MSTFSRWGTGMLGVAIVTGVVLVRSQSTPDVAVATPGAPARLGLDILRSDIARSPSGLVLRVTAYEPPRVGTVAIVARLENARTGETREVGRFGMFPDAPFRAASPNDAQRFALKLGIIDLEWVQRAETHVSVVLEPAGGDGAGARLVTGGLELRDPR